MPPFEMIAIRHGETVENRNRIIQGHLPGKLTEKGKERAFKIGEILKNQYKIDMMISSDLNRCVQTAEIIHSLIPHCRLLYHKSLRERDFGDLQGKPVFALNRLAAGGSFNPMTVPVPKGEAYHDFNNRIEKFIRDVIFKTLHSSILIITHFGVIYEIQKITGKKRIILTENCEGLVFRIKNSRLFLHRVFK